MGKVTMPGSPELSLGASHILDASERFTYDLFRTCPIFEDQDGIGDPTGATGDVNIMKTERASYEYEIKGAGQTILAPVFTAAGSLDIALDQAADEGVEITQGITARSRAAYVVGTDAFYMRCTLDIEDVSGTDDCAIGFRKAEAYQVNIDDYDEMAVLNVISGNITSETILNGGGTTATDSGEDWGDTEEHTLEVRVDIGGYVSFWLDGAQLTAAESGFQFDSGEVLVPFLFFLNTGDFAGEVLLHRWEVGVWQARGIESLTDSRN
jgi:hypothetical protein